MIGHEPILRADRMLAEYHAILNMRQRIEYGTEYFGVAWEAIPTVRDQARAFTISTMEARLREIEAEFEHWNDSARMIRELAAGAAAASERSTELREIIARMAIALDGTRENDKFGAYEELIGEARALIGLSEKKEGGE